jgi:NAD(P)-dependent dehydrogenase (short-subunit alcohol dehydrogenase family)
MLHRTENTAGEITMNIQGSVVFVTGANRGFGLAIAREALASGAAKVYAGMRNTEGFNVPGIVPVKLDVTDPDSVAAAAALCPDTNVLVNNAGIARIVTGPLDVRMESLSREVFEANFYGMIRVTRAFAPALARNGGGAVINVLSDITWLPARTLAAYAASKTAAWSFTNSLRLQLKDQGTQVLALHVGYMDTDLAKAVTAAKSDPRKVARATLDALAEGKHEVIADESSRALKAGLSSEAATYLGA